MSDYLVKAVLKCLFSAFFLRDGAKLG